MSGGSHGLYIALCHHRCVESLISFTKILKKADLEGSLAALHSEEAASLTPSRYILLVESGLIDMTE